MTARIIPITANLVAVFMFSFWSEFVKLIEFFKHTLIKLNTFQPTPPGLNQNVLS